MKHYILHIIFFLLLSINTSCRQPPQYISYSDPYNLENIDWNMDVYKYYCEGEGVFAANRERTIKHSDNHDITIYIDTAHIYWRENDYPFEQRDQAIGIEYNMMGWLSCKPIATYEMLTFRSIDMITNLDNKLIAVCAVNDRTENIEDIKAFMKKLQKGINVEYAKRGFYSDKEIYAWQQDNLVFKILIEYSSVGYIHLELTKDEDGNLIDASSEQRENPLPTSSLFIVKKEYKDKIDNISTGKFSNF